MIELNAYILIFYWFVTFFLKHTFCFLYRKRHTGRVWFEILTSYAFAHMSFNIAASFIPSTATSSRYLTPRLKLCTTFISYCNGIFVFIFVEELAKSLYAYLSLARRSSCHIVPTHPSSGPLSTLFVTLALLSQFLRLYSLKSYWLRGKPGIPKAKKKMALNFFNV